MANRTYCVVWEHGPRAHVCNLTDSAFDCQTEPSFHSRSDGHVQHQGLELMRHGTGEPEHRIPPGGRLDQNTHEAIPSAHLQGYLEIGRSTGDGVIRVHSMLVVKQGY